MKSPKSKKIGENGFYRYCDEAVCFDVPNGYKVDAYVRYALRAYGIVKENRKTPIATIQIRDDDDSIKRMLTNFVPLDTDFVQQTVIRRGPIQTGTYEGIELLIVEKSVKDKPRPTSAWIILLCCGEQCIYFNLTAKIGFDETPWRQILNSINMHGTSTEHHVDLENHGQQNQKQLNEEHKQIISNIQQISSNIKIQPKAAVLVSTTSPKQKRRGKTRLKLPKELSYLGSVIDELSRFDPEDLDESNVEASEMVFAAIRLRVKEMPRTEVEQTLRQNLKMLESICAAPELSASPIHFVYGILLGIIMFNGLDELLK